MTAAGAAALTISKSAPASVSSGQNLAYTIAVLTVLLVLVVRFALTPAYPMEVEPEEPSPPAG